MAALMFVMMPAPVWSWVPQWLAWTILIFAGFFALLTANAGQPAVEQFSLDESGILIRTAIDRKPVEEHPFVIEHQSRVTALVIYLFLKPARGRTIHRWIFRSQCCERDYRRLCRQISRTSRHVREKT
ncbi:protein YgfX [Alteromonas antoniana]|uniref:protein YgfX n=1 Tax=Alteromonas antoniana TaxID=2803813 RepID=UPI001C451601|nr:protein YgfX [Alteromonas antoniana]